MKSRLILCAALLSLVHVAFAAESPDLETRRFPVLPSVIARMGEGGIDEWKDSHGQLGVEWPEGSFIKSLPSLGELAVRNTQENMFVIEDFFTFGGRGIPLLIEVQVDFIEFKMEDVDKLAREGELSASSLLAIWRKGDAKLLYTPRVITRDGFEATVRGVTEYIYPTEFEVATPISTNAPRSTVVSGVVEPSEFETRQVGVILSCLPERNYGNMIDVTLTPETVYSPTWKNYGSRHEGAGGQKEELPMEQPFFHAHTIATRVTVADGATVMIAGGMNNPVGDKTVFAFMTARLLDINGNPIKTGTEAGEQKN